MSDWNSGIIDEFRANAGVVGGVFEGRTLLLLHTVGARSGVDRITPLVYREEDDRVFIFASKAGAHSHPDWYHNVVKNPDVTIEVGDRTLDATAREADRDLRDGVYSRQAADWQNFAEYQAATDRVIPVIELVLKG